MQNCPKPICQDGLNLYHQTKIKVMDYTTQTIEIAQQAHKVKREFFVEIIFGMSSKKCIRHGICKMEETQDLTQDVPTMPTGRCFGKITIQCDMVLIDFYRKAMDEMTLKKHFRKKYFLFEEQSFFQIGDKNICIQVGMYEITQYPYMYRIKINQ